MLVRATIVAIKSGRNTMRQDEEGGSPEEKEEGGEVQGGEGGFSDGASLGYGHQLPWELSKEVGTASRFRYVNCQHPCVSSRSKCAGASSPAGRGTPASAP